MSIPLPRAGRRFAYTPSSLRRPSSPCSGRTGLPSSSGRPTAARRTASACTAGRERLVGQRRPLREDRVAAERVLGVGDPERVEHADRLGGDLGPDPVAREDGDVGHRESLVTRCHGALVVRAS